MGRDERLIAGPGFAAFGRRPDFAANLIIRTLELDPAIRHLVYVYNDTSSLALGDAVREICAIHDVALRMVPWSTYGNPGNVAAVEALPSESLTFVLADQRRTVGDRLDVRRSYMRRKAARRRIVVDVVPYEVLPWRTYFPFAFFDRNLLGYHHSYAIEQDYERFLDGHLEENPCDPARLAEKTWRAAFVDAPAFFIARPELVELRASARDHAAYGEVRDGLFTSEKSIAGVKSKLARWIQQRYPERAIPHDMKRVYAPGLTRLVHTDLPFDRWLVREIVGLMDHTDALLGLYARYQNEAGG